MKPHASCLPRLFAGLSLLLILSGCGRGEARKLQEENSTLRAEIAALRERAVSPENETARANELKRLQDEARDAARLRGEVTRLRTTSQEAEKLRAENQQLRAENQRLRGPTTPAANPPASEPGTFLREGWTLAGYASPENALISAIWSMQQGNPRQYFDSLTPEEQLRMTKVWENKTPEEIAAKHQNDTARITSLRVLDQQVISENEVRMNVFIGGVDRTEKVVMKRATTDGQWKFGGYIREPAKP